MSNVVGRRTLEDLQNGINSAKNTQTAIRFVATHFEKTIDKLEQSKNEQKQEMPKEELLEFNPNEIETLVYRKKQFKQGLSVDVSGKVERKEVTKDTTIEKERD